MGGKLLSPCLKSLSTISGKADYQDYFAENFASVKAITKRILYPDGEQTYFKMKQSVQMRKVFDVYAARKALPRDLLHISLGRRTCHDGCHPQLVEST